MKVQKDYITKYSEYSIPIWEEKYQSIEVIPSGPFSNKIGTNSEYPLPEDMKGTYNIPLNNLISAV